MRLDTILLDVDGTLMDTREFVFRGFEHALSLSGGPIPTRAELAARIGPPLEEIYADLVGLERADEMVRSHRAFQAANLGLSRAYPGAADALERLRSAGFRLAAVTSRSRLTSVDSLERCELLPLLEVVISAEDAVALKPDPRHLEAALRALGTTSGGVAMVGDTPADIEGGRNIGATTIGALYGFHGAELLACKPDRCIDDVRELPDAILEVSRR